MRLISWLKSAAIISSFALIYIPALARPQNNSQQSSGDPIADAARRSREAKQNAPKSRKVYTDDDISRPKPAPAATPAASGTAQTPAGTDVPANTASTADQDKQNEAAWRRRFKDQRDRIARAEKELDILQRESQKKEIQYYPDPQKAMNEQYTRKDINETLAKIEAKRQEIATLKQGLSDLEDELRKFGGNPGWARE
jgi:hypothetical protein